MKIPLTIINSRMALISPLLIILCSFLSCTEAEKRLHTTPNSQRLIDHLAIEDPLTYVTMALDEELQNWADAMDEDWCM